MSEAPSSGANLTWISIISVERIVNDGHDSSFTTFFATACEDEISHVGS